jgi:hypothetical protein
MTTHAHWHDVCCVSRVCTRIRRGHITRTYLRIAYNPVFKDRAEDSSKWITPLKNSSSIPASGIRRRLSSPPFSVRGRLFRSPGSLCQPLFFSRSLFFPNRPEVIRSVRCDRQWRREAHPSPHPPSLSTNLDHFFWIHRFTRHFRHELHRDIPGSTFVRVEHLEQRHPSGISIHRHSSIANVLLPPTPR